MGTRTPTTDLDTLLAGAPPLLKTRAAAELAGVHQKTIERAIRSQKLQAVKPGKNYLIPRNALRRWLEKGIS